MKESECLDALSCDSGYSSPARRKLFLNDFLCLRIYVSELLTIIGEDKSGKSKALPQASVLLQWSSTVPTLLLTFQQITL